VDQTTYPVNRGRERGGEQGSRDKVTKRRIRGKEGVEQERGPGTLG